jgi:serine/threonine-protein kinase
MSVVAEHVTEPELELPVGPGDVVAEKYVVERVLGAGGMGAVLLAHHRELGQRFAIKVQLRSVIRSKDATARFLQEARAASRLSSPNAVRVVDLGTLPDGSPFLAMEYLEGVDLDVHLARCGGRLSVKEAVRTALDVCDALAEAHALGIIHRDLKPSNLFLASRPVGRPLVKVLDFGISKVLDASISGRSRALTRTHAVMGTPAYMAPEQCLASKTVDARADIWSLGVCMYEMLAGRLPFDAETPVELGALLATEEPPPIRELRPDVPVELADAIHRCLAKKPEGRFDDVAALAHVLEAIARMPAEPAVATRPTIPSDAPIFSQPTLTDYSSRSGGAAAAAPPSRPGRGSRTLVVSLLVIASVAIAAATVFRTRAQADSADRPTRERSSSPAEAPPSAAAPAISEAPPIAIVHVPPPAADAGAATEVAPPKKRPPARSPAAPFPNER